MLGVLESKNAKIKVKNAICLRQGYAGQELWNPDFVGMAISIAVSLSYYLTLNGEISLAENLEKNRK